MAAASYAQPALVGGLVMGVLSALPVISAGNLCCCLWVVSGGLVASYVLQQNQAAPVSSSDGAVAGLLAGIVGAFVASIVSIPVDLLVAPLQRAMLDQALEMAGTVPPQMREFLEAMNARPTAAPLLWIAARLTSFFFTLFLGMVFSTLGGLVGAAIFRKRLPPGTIDAAPSAS
jgi:hypothetical protein